MPKPNETLPRYLHGVVEPKHDPVSRAYLELIKNDCSLPEPATEEQKQQSILIVGAGVAGLVAANFLKNAGYEDITILEANTRVGGRCKTFKNPPEDESQYSEIQKRYPPATSEKVFEGKNCQGEAGAMRIPESHQLVMSLMEDYLGLVRDTDLTQFFNYPVDSQGAETKENTRRLHVNMKRMAWCDYERHVKNVSRQSPGHDALGYDLENDWEKCLTADELLDTALRSDDDISDIYSIHELLEHDNLDPDTRTHEEERLRTAWWKVIRKYDSVSLRGFLEQAGLSRGAIEMIGVIANLEARMPLSFVHSLKSRMILNRQQTFWQIRGGTENLAKYLVEKLFENDPSAWLDAPQDGTPKILLNQKLTDINRVVVEENGECRFRAKVRTEIVREWTKSQDPKGELAARDATYQSNLQEREFDQVIVTIPFSSLRMVRISKVIRSADATIIDHSFSRGKLKAIRQLYYDAATKVLLEFKRPFWLDEQYGGLNGGYSVTDLPNRTINFPRIDDPSQPCVLLATYSWSDDARKWDSMTPIQRFRLALENVSVVHGLYPSGVSEATLEKAQKDLKDEAVFDGVNLTGAATESWATNPFAFGEAAVFRPGQLLDLFPSIIRSEWETSPQSGQGLIHFAGDHASQKSAWIEGAIESGIRCALVTHHCDPYHGLS